MSLFFYAVMLTASTARAVTPPPGALNPDVTQANIGATICLPNWTATVRPPAAYTDALKRKQLGPGVNLSLYEEDHLVPLALGGAPRDPNNLWPQLWAGPMGAHDKDRLESLLHSLVCSKVNPLPLATAQAAIRTDWKAAYRKYVCGKNPGIPQCRP
jgi:hypothetical protein